MVILVWFLLMISLLACGKKANPVIPVKVIPNGIENLSYQIKGKTLIVFWGIPTQNTDGSPLTDLKGFRVQKGEWPTKDFCATCPDQFQETLWIDLKGPELPDIRIEPDQVQLILNRLKPGNTYFFQVTAVTRKETASKPSKTLHLSWELPLAPPSATSGETRPKGSVDLLEPIPNVNRWDTRGRPGRLYPGTENGERTLAEAQYRPHKRIEIYRFGTSGKRHLCLSG